MWSRIGSMRRRRSTGSSRGECWTAAVPERPTAPRNMVPAVRAALPSTRDAQSSVAVSAPSDKAAGGWLLQPSLAALAATYGGDTSARCGDSAVGGTGQPAASKEDWLKLCELMQTHYSIQIDPSLIQL